MPVEIIEFVGYRDWQATGADPNPGSSIRSAMQHEFESHLRDPSNVQALTGQYFGVNVADVRRAREELPVAA